MKRSPMPRRKAWIARGKRINRVYRAHQARNFERAYGGSERVEWIKAQPCCISGSRGDVVNAHIKSDGAGRKADARFIVPMSAPLHREFHDDGIATFAAKYAVDLFELAAATERAWQQAQNAERAS